MLALCIETARGAGRTSIVRLVGSLDLATAPRLVAGVAAVLEHQPRQVVLDCGGCRFVDTAGLAAMVAAHRAAGGAGVTLGLAGIDKRLRLLLDRTNLFRVLREVPVPTPASWDDDPATAIDAAAALRPIGNRRDP